MKRRITVLTIFFVILIAWTGSVYAQTAKPAAVKLLKLPNGEEVFDINGEWDLIAENYGEWEKF